MQKKCTLADLKERMTNCVGIRCKRTTYTTTLHFVCFSSSLCSLTVFQYLRMIFEEDGEESQEKVDQELALAKAVDAMEMSLQSTTKSEQNQNQHLDANSEAELIVGALNLDDSPVNYQRKVSLLYELLSACIADIPPQDDSKSTRFRKGYDARHRAALRLLSTWLNVKWAKMVCLFFFLLYSIQDYSQL
jgi:hypothetical protein